MKLFNHSAHDSELLLQQWHCLGKELGLIETQLTDDVNAYHSQDFDDAYYVSAGVHGDECAPVWALLEWAKLNREWIQDHPILFIPCFNPDGLQNNTRVDSKGRDLNRCFQDVEVPVIAGWQKLIDGKRFRRCLHLHEDYDANGIYLYEVAKQVGRGREILQQCRELISIDSRRSIDGVDFDTGLVSHHPDSLSDLVDVLLSGGYPEAIYLAIHCSASCFTFETPSELDLGARTEAHIEAIDTFVRSN